ncbi:S10 family peptidase [Kozakia baliensis]|uniref:Peptidase S10 n=1 Tax=Kozakia baliensis TaxID=153496 RepID=A0A1D8UR93_9PROT|nr:peptidase S10 [Kozakia baliensis]AOX16158.1 peptidase S10 [Kozakia baliensis]GBR23007.1 peptidase S10 serine carboxypeptidase [Kozakia baliensis NRIC 0488]GEL65336.1 peptidase S10 [Kozakia baliensis]
MLGKSLAAFLLTSVCLYSSPFVSPAIAAEAPKADSLKETGLASLLPVDAITKHHFSAGGHALAYTAHTGTLTLRDDEGKPAAKVFYVAYTQDGANLQKRPVSFFFNGGPGAGSAYLNLGAAGPRVLQFPKDTPLDGANATLVDNPDSWLPATDMVFIDAVGTGYSRPIDPAKAAAQYYGVQKDGAAFAKAIELWVGQNGRQASPHYLVGESYGGIRSVQVAYALQQQQNLIVNGIVMISPAIQMQFLDTANNPMASAMALPSFIASHLDETHQLTPQAIDDAYRYALGPYLTTLANVPPQGQEAEKFYAEVAQRTGLPESVVAKQRGALDPMSHDVRSRDGKLHGLYDFTQTMADPYPEGVDNSDSPEMTLAGFGRAYGNAFAGYAANELGYRTELTYDLLSMNVNEAWNYGGHGSPMTDQVSLIRKLLALDPKLQIFVANGYFDMACPFGTTRWVHDHIPVGADRMKLHLYPGGHMLYARPDSRAALAHDVSAYYGAQAH